MQIDRPRGVLPVSVIIMTRNEERVITRTLESVARFDQVFVVDSNSDDSTAELAAAAGATVVNFSWDGQYPKKKEWCMSNLPFQNDWVLYLDADEVVAPQLVDEIEETLATVSETTDAFDVEIEYHFLGRRLDHGHRVVKRVLLRHARTTWPQVPDLAVSNMWEVEGHYQPQVNGEVRKLTHRLGHEDLDPLYDYFQRHNRYSDWEAYLLVHPEAGRVAMDSRSARGQRYAHVPFRALAFFVYSYLVRGGWRDGSPGLHYAVAQTFYQWQVQVKAREARIKTTP